MPAFLDCETFDGIEDEGFRASGASVAQEEAIKRMISSDARICSGVATRPSAITVAPVIDSSGVELQLWFVTGPHVGRRARLLQMHGVARAFVRPESSSSARSASR